MSQHILGGDHRLEFKKQARELRECRSYLVARHYMTRDVIRIHGLRSCRLHFLCPGCAMARGSRHLASYIPKHDALLAEYPNLRSQLLTVTVKDGFDLAERTEHLIKSLREFFKRRHRGRGSEAERIKGAVYSVEVKRGEGSGQWHPHAHIFVLVEDGFPLRQHAVEREWRDITGDSFIVDVRDTYGEPADAFCEVFKYALKLSGLPLDDALHAYRILRGQRLIGSIGLFFGVEVSESEVDELLDDLTLPFLDLMWTYMGSRSGASYWHSDVCATSKIPEAA